MRACAGLCLRKVPFPRNDRIQALPGALTLSLHLSPAPLARPFRLLGELFGKCVRHADFLTPQKSRLTHLYIIQGEGRIRWGEKPPPIYIYICVGKSEFLELEGRRGVGALSGIFMAFRCRHNLISKGRIKSKYVVRCLNWQTINSWGPGQ